MVKSNCKLCGAPLKKGNIHVVRKPGKRPYRICRRCPQARSEAVQIVGNIESTGNALQPPQVSTGGPLAAEGVFNYPDPPRYRYFVTRAMAEKLQRAIKGGHIGIMVEVIPVPSYQVEANLDGLDDYVEIELKGGMYHD